MSRRFGPFFDFTPLAKWVALLLPAYFVAIPVLGLTIAVIYFISHPVGTALLHIWAWVPAIFPLAALVLVADLWSHLHLLRPSQVVGHRAAGVFTAAGSALGISFNHLWVLPAITVALCAALMFTPRTRALASGHEESVS